MTSSRLPWNSETNALTRLLGEKRARGASILDLTQSNPTKAGIEYPRDSILAATGDRRALSYEPSPRGLFDARRAVADFLRVPAESVLLTASTSEAYSFLFKMLCDPGDAVLTPQPSYPLFDHLAALEGVRTEPYALRIDDAWSFDLTRRVGKARAVVAVNPNNPTGSYVTERDLEAVRSTGLPLISDEVFFDYAFGAPGPAARSAADLSVFTLGGLSKSAGLPQIKLGWIVATGPGASEALDRLAAVADAYLSVSAVAMHAAPKLLGLAPIISRIISLRTRTNLSVLSHAAGATLREPQGGWYAVVEAPSRKTDEAWALELLGEADVLVHPGYFYGFPREAFLVLSLLTPETEFAEGVRRMMARF